MTTITFSASTMLEQNVRIIADVTPSELVDGLNNGIYFTTVSHGNRPTINDVTGRAVAQIIDQTVIDSDCQYDDFELYEDDQSVIADQSHLTETKIMQMAGCASFELALVALYNEFCNNHLTVKRFSDHYGLDVDDARQILLVGKEISTAKEKQVELKKILSSRFIQIKTVV